MPYYPPASSGGGYATVQEEGSSLPQQTTMNFVGAGVTAADGASKTTVTIPGGAADISKIISSDSTINTDTCRYIVGHLEVASGIHLTIAAAGSLEVG